MSFGVLLLLCMSMGMILVSAQRAQRLAKAQMEFVAGVSHELRTPLAVICSAAENLADGVVGAKEQVTRYGTLIRDEGRRLTGMVEQTLQFAAGQSNRKTYQLKRHGVEEIVEKALHQSAPAIENAGYRLEKTVDADLPAVEVDAAALSQSLQNLIGNAVKYGGANRWVGVRAEAAEAPGGEREVRISVEDKGLGIRSQDLPHVFDPFFRGEQATVRQIPRHRPRPQPGSRRGRSHGGANQREKPRRAKAAPLRSICLPPPQTACPRPNPLEPWRKES